MTAAKGSGTGAVGRLPHLEAVEIGGYREQSGIDGEPVEDPVLENLGRHGEERALGVRGHG